MVWPRDASAIVVVELAPDVGLVVVEEKPVAEEPAVVTAPVLDVLGKTDAWQAAKSSPAKSTATIPPTQRAGVSSLLIVRSPLPCCSRRVFVLERRLSSRIGLGRIIPAGFAPCEGWENAE